MRSVIFRLSASKRLTSLFSGRRRASSQRIGTCRPVVSISSFAVWKNVVGPSDAHFGLVRRPERFPASAQHRPGYVLVYRRAIRSDSTSYSIRTHAPRHPVSGDAPGSGFPWGGAGDAARLGRLPVMVIQLPVQERRAQPRHRKYREPELRATGPTTSGLQPLIPSASSPVSRSLNHFPDVLSRSRCEARR